MGSNGRMIAELEKIWKEEVLAHRVVILAFA
jgi:hypothetical protein